MAEEVLFVETSTYEHDYKLPDKKFYTKAIATKNEPNLYNNYPAGMKLRSVHDIDERRSNPLLDVPPKRYMENEVQQVLERRPKSLLSKTLGNVFLHELSDQKREEFLSYTYRTTYNELVEHTRDKVISPSHGEWNDEEEKRLKQTYSTRIQPENNFKIPMKVIQKWAGAQPRCQRGDTWFYKAKRVRDNPFPDYPQALLSLVGQNRLTPQFDPGRQIPGYTGYRNHFLDFSKSVDDLLAKGQEFCDTHGVPWKLAQDLPKYTEDKHKKVISSQ